MIVFCLKKDFVMYKHKIVSVCHVHAYLTFKNDRQHAFGISLCLFYLVRLSLATEWSRVFFLARGWVLHADWLVGQNAILVSMGPDLI